jgi:hypothetical protein
LRTSSMRSCHRSQTNLTWFLDIGILLTLAFRLDWFEILRIWIASEINASLPDLCCSEFLADVEQRERLEGLPVELHTFPKLKVGFACSVSPHGEPPLISSCDKPEVRA